MPSKLVSVVIITRNERALLPRLLDALEKQTHPPYEIIVADAQSTDDTRDIAKSHGCRVIEGGGLAFGRNEGAKAARGDVLFFFDADVLPDERFLERFLRRAEKTQADVASCFLVPDDIPVARGPRGSSAGSRSAARSHRCSRCARR